MVIRVIVIIGLFLMGFFIYWYPVQKNMAEKAFVQYLEKQGIPEKNIKSKRIIKDYTQGGYIISVKIKDEPDLVYEYIWSKSRGIVLLVFKNGAGIDDGMKYPPFD
jgi:hypothetical protein